MKWEKWLDQWNLNELEINSYFLKMKWAPIKSDKDAAWELHAEMVTRIVTQPLPDSDGDLSTALHSIYSLFGTTRQIIRNYGRDCIEFSKLSIMVLNQVVRPFTAKMASSG